MNLSTLNDAQREAESGGEQSGWNPGRTSQSVIQYSGAVSSELTGHDDMASRYL